MRCWGRFNSFSCSMSVSQFSRASADKKQRPRARARASQLPAWWAWIDFTCGLTAASAFELVEARKVTESNSCWIRGDTWSFPGESVSCQDQQEGRGHTDWSLVSYPLLAPAPPPRSSEPSAEALSFSWEVSSLLNFDTILLFPHLCIHSLVLFTKIIFAFSVHALVENVNTEM